MPRHFVFSSILCSLLSWHVAIGAESPGPLKVLLVTGGCCHDYDFQAKMLTSAVEDRGIEVKWTIVKEGGKGTAAQIPLYDDPSWAEGYDVVIHNECFANTKDPDYIRRITSAHKKGANAVVIHCAMHTYRATKIDDWREFLGVTSRRHEHQSRYPVKVVAKDHPIMRNFPANYTTPKDELYVIEHVWPETTVLATSASERTSEGPSRVLDQQVRCGTGIRHDVRALECDLRRRCFSRHRDSWPAVGSGTELGVRRGVTRPGFPSRKPEGDRLRLSAVTGH